MTRAASNPLTAHGITDALCDAELLARAWENQRDLELLEYQTLRNDSSRLLFQVLIPRALLWVPESGR